MNKKIPIILGIGLLIIDILSKYLAKTYEINMCLISDLLCLRYTQNFGISFGMFSNIDIITIIIPIVIILCIGYWFIKSNKLITNIALILILVGAGSNLIDRIFYGYVIDFIDINFFVCNISDICIFIGACVLLFTYKGQDGNVKC